MKVLVVGSGGREHAICWRLKKDGAQEVFCAPGNAGTQIDGIENIDINPDEFGAIASFCKKRGVELVVVGPEKPLCNGIADYLMGENITVFGPVKRAAMLEGSKIFAKRFMKKYKIPTAQFDTAHDASHAYEIAKNMNFRCAIKVDGLAAGKGVFVCRSESDVTDALDVIFKERRFGASGSSVVVEELLEGEEASYIVMVGRGGYISFPPSQDHKPVYDGDRGPNTGGMGAYAPCPLVDERLEHKIIDTIVEPTLSGLNNEDIDFFGFLYIGLMIDEEGPKVLEFNVRMGDPETQPLLFGIDDNFIDLLIEAKDGAFHTKRVSFSGYTVCVVMAQSGYPGSYKKGMLISGLDDPFFNNDWIKVFHAGTVIKEGSVFTNGGRVLGITARGDDIKSAIKRAYEGVDKIHWEGRYFRKDIAKKALKRLQQTY